MLTTNQEVTTVRPPLPTVAPLACLITYLSNNIFGVIDFLKKFTGEFSPKIEIEN
jgi:hypothetical protein